MQETERIPLQETFNRHRDQDSNGIRKQEFGNKFVLLGRMYDLIMHERDWHCSAVALLHSKNPQQGHASQRIELQHGRPAPQHARAAILCCPGLGDVPWVWTRKTGSDGRVRVASPIIAAGAAPPQCAACTWGTANTRGQAEQWSSQTRSSRNVIGKHCKGTLESMRWTGSNRTWMIK